MNGFLWRGLSGDISTTPSKKVQFMYVRGTFVVVYFYQNLGQTKGKLLFNTYRHVQLLVNIKIIVSLN